jgi:hypothetical protein
MQKLVALGVLGLFAILLSGTAAAEGENPDFQTVQQDVKDLGNIELIVGSKSMTVSWQGIEIGATTSSFLREKVDGLDGSDPDGDVNADEADAAELLLRQYVQNEFDVYAHDDRFNDYLLIDQSSPKAADVSSLVASGIEGPVQSDQGIVLSFASVIAFPTRSADVHTVKLDMGRYYFRSVDEQQAGDAVGDFSITVKGADGWTIGDVQPDCAADNLQDGALVFTSEDLDCFTDRTGVLLGFTITGHDDDSAFNIPGFESIGLVAALGASVLLLRRRM